MGREWIPSLPVGAGPERWALFLDIDGTLLEFSDRIGDATMPPELIVTLRRLHERFEGALALVSGRTLESIDALLAPLKLPVAGEYGLALRVQGTVEWLGSPLANEVRAVLDSIALRHGVAIEHKNRAATLHFRHDPALGPIIESELIMAWNGSPDRPHVTRGRSTLDIMMQADSKAAAIAAFLAIHPFSGRRPVFVGDDIVDRPGFALVNARGGLSFQVGGSRSAAECASGYFESPGAVRRWLAELGERP